MEPRSDEGGWICSRRGKEMLYKDMGIRSKWENVANEGQESELEDGAGCIDGVWVDEGVLQVLCKLFFN